MHSVNDGRLQHDPSARPPTENLTVVPAGNLDLDERLSTEYATSLENEVFLRIASPERVTADDLFRPEGTAGPPDEVEARPAHNSSHPDSQRSCRQLDRPGAPTVMITAEPLKPGLDLRRPWWHVLHDWFALRRAAWRRAPAVRASAEDVGSLY